MLEPDRAPCGVIPSPTSPQTPANISDAHIPPQPGTNKSPPPIYQEITEISTNRGRMAATIGNGGSIPNTPLSTSSSLPLIQRPLSVPIADSGTPNQWVNNVKHETMV